jgi:hypothetical protein
VRDSLHRIFPELKFTLSTVLGDAQGGFERALARTNLADIVADIREREC